MRPAPPVVAAPPPPPPAPAPAPAPAPPPPRALTEDEAFARKTVEQLNAEMPLGEPIGRIELVEELSFTCVGVVDEDAAVDPRLDEAVDVA